MHFKKSVLKNHLLYSIITLMAIAMLFPITAFAQAYVQTWDLVDSGKHLDYDGNSTYMSYINTGAATWNRLKMAGRCLTYLPSFRFYTYM